MCLIEIEAGIIQRILAMCILMKIMLAILSGHDDVLFIGADN